MVKGIVELPVQMLDALLLGNLPHHPRHISFPSGLDLDQCSCLKGWNAHQGVESDLPETSDAMVFQAPGLLGSLEEVFDGLPGLPPVRGCSAQSFAQGSRARPHPPLHPGTHRLLNYEIRAARRTLQRPWPISAHELPNAGLGFVIIEAPSARPSSSGGQSGCLLSSGSRVRILPGTPQQL